MRSFWTTLLILAAGAAAVIVVLLRTEELDREGTPIPAAPSTPPSALIAPPSVAPVVEPARPTPAPAAQSANPPAVPSSVAANDAPAGDSLPIGLDQKIEGATVAPGRIVAKDGALVADGKFTIRGKGTAEDPYDISWDLLMSASDTFIPRLGEKRIPQRIALLNNSHVRIGGFIAFPLVVTEASECLVMLNQWDGCCIGVPPSPYDAIEVKLKAATDNSVRHQIRVGTLEGVFHIDPYVVERWLVGLYTMDAATLSTEM